MASSTARFAATGCCALALTVGALTFTRARAQPDEGQDVGMLLVEGLRSTEGCLKVELGQTMSRRNCIFAWFDSKAAVERWYYSPTHQNAMRMLMPTFDREQQNPMPEIADDIGPILVVASLIDAPQNELAEVDMPISAIAIELYKPLPGGAYINSSFGPPEIYPSIKAYPGGPPHGAE